MNMQEIKNNFLFIVESSERLPCHILIMNKTDFPAEWYEILMDHSLPCLQYRFLIYEYGVHTPWTDIMMAIYLKSFLSETNDPLDAYEQFRKKGSIVQAFIFMKS